jgi:nucleotide-binding universal stress UspA family protein
VADPDRRPFHKILLALEPDGASVTAWRVLEALARPGPDLLVCHVVLRPTSVAGNELDGNPANPEELAINRTLRARLVEHLGSVAREVPIRILHGDPGQRICEYAEYAGCDLIVLVRHPSSLSRRLHGSVSRYVATNSRRSVLILGD